MRLWSLGSGSKGNAMLLECGGSRVLVDAGFPPRTLAQRLRKIGVSPESIESLVITHEHGDHVRGAAAAAARWGWEVHASTGTAGAAPELHEADVRTFEAGATLRLRSVDVQTVPTSHDAAESVALVATARESGTRVGIAYDLGVVTPPVLAAFTALDLLVVESNHDEGMLRAGPYPWVVQQRIASRRGHLNNRAAATFARECVHRGLRQVILAHISEQCNDHELAAGAMRSSLGRAGWRGHVQVALQRGVVGPFTPSGGRASVEAQLSLAL